MFESIRSAMARSHAGAAAILFLLAYACYNGAEILSLPFWGLMEIVNALGDGPGWLHSPMINDAYPQLRLVWLVIWLSRIAFYYFAAWALSHWVYRARPIQVLSSYRHPMKRLSND